MQEIRKSVIKYSSANEKDTVTGYFYEASNTSEIKGILQISHGMREYMARYDEFANFMVKNGYIVCGNDHLGHGKTSDTQIGIDGFFTQEDTKACVLLDLLKMNELAKRKFPNVPVIMLGHSMGSFFSRIYAVTYPKTIDALIISGTSTSNPLGGIGKVLASAISKLKGEDHRSKFLDNMAFGAYNNKIANPKTKYDWLTQDENIVDDYANDKKCTSTFTVNGFRLLMDVLSESNTLECAQKLNKDMPIYIFSGALDPVGGYGKGTTAVYELIKSAGVKDVSLKLYENGRHEMLNELNRQDVYSDVLNWCNKHINVV